MPFNNSLLKINEKFKRIERNFDKIKKREPKINRGSPHWFIRIFDKYFLFIKIVSCINKFKIKFNFLPRVKKEKRRNKNDKGALEVLSPSV